MSATATTDIAAAVGFLEQRFGEVHTGYAVLGFIKDGATTHGYINLQAPDRWERAAHIIERHIETHDCYAAVGVFKETKRRNPATGRDEFRTTEMIAFVNALYLERDAARYPDALPPPSYTVETSTGSFQDYLSLGEHIDAETAGRYLRRLAAAAGLGHQAVDAARLLRMPGTCNRKANRNGEIVTVVADTGPVYRLADFDHLPDVQPKPGPRHTATGDGTIPNGQRNSTLASLAGTMRRRGMGEAAIRVALIEENAARCDPPLDDDEVRRIAESVGRYAPAQPMATNGARKSDPHADDHAPDDDTGQEAEPTPTKEHADNLPMIDAGNHNLPVVTQQAWGALTAKNDPPFLFQHGGVPSRLQYGEDGRILLVPLTEHRLRHEVAQAAEWYITKGKEQRVFAAEPPLSVIQNMLAGAELPLPVLRSITETPVFAPDGRLIEAAGFDDASGIYVQPVAGLIVPPVPEKPTAADVANARNLVVDDLLGDFPFTEEADRAAAVALFILPFVRAMIRGLTPMHGIESPTVGSGKGLLGDVLVRPAFGQHGGMIAEARDDDEWRKRIGAKLREGAPIIHIDNVTRPLDSGALAMALTAPVFSDRVLGQTATFRATVRNVWMFTANNPVMSLEIARRTVRIRIDTNEEKPWQRDTFTHKNLRAWADTHRGDLVHAALTLVRAWIVAGKPMADVTLGSYEEWAATMGGILATANVPNFLDNMAAFYEAADVEGAAWRQFVARWAEAHGSNKVGVGDLFTLASEVDSFDFGKGGDRSQRTSFGAQLTKQRDRIYDGYRITLAGEYRKAKQWRLLPVKPGRCEPRQQRFTQDSAAIATETGEGVNLCEPFPIPPAEEKMNNISLEHGGEKVHIGSHENKFPLTGQGKKGVNLRGGGSPEGETALAADDLPDRVALRQWAEDEALGWENTTFTEAAIREATRRYYALTIPQGTARKEVADLIVAALKDRPR